MMNGKAFEKRINRDFDRARRDLAALRNDAVIGLGVKLEQLAGGPRKAVAKQMKALNKSIEQGLNQYNTKVQDVIDRVPGDLGKKAVKHPWVVFTASVLLGLLLGTFLRFGRHPGR